MDIKSVPFYIFIVIFYSFVFQILLGKRQLIQCDSIQNFPPFPNTV